ncbi:MAG: DUF1244 domain-containing protein [Bauldia sp.]
MDKKDREAFEAAAFRRLVDHLRHRSDVQNIDLMNFAGFCRNCLANWFQDAAREGGQDISKAAARELIYGMPYEEWQAKNQKPTTADALAAFAKNRPQH